MATSNLLLSPTSLQTAVTTAVNNAAAGSKSAAGCQVVASAIGNPYWLSLYRNGTRVFRARFNLSLTVVNGVITLPTSYSALDTLSSASISSGTWLGRVESNDGQTYVQGKCSSSGSDPFTLNGDLVSGGTVLLGGITMQFDPQIDVVAPSSAKPVGLPNYAGALTFEDHFTGSSLDSSKWVLGIDWWNPPLEYSFDNMDVTNSTLRVWPKAGTGGVMTYTTITTRNKFEQRFGFFEARMKLSKGMTFDAFWLYHVATQDEIDIMEDYSGQDPAAEWGFGSGVNAYPSRYGATIHKQGGGGAGGTSKGPIKSKLTGTDLSADFHTYGCLWDATGCTFFLDGQPMDIGGETVSGQTLGSGRIDLALNNNPMFILFDFKPNFHAGTATASNTTMGVSNACLVDYVRAWA